MTHPITLTIIGFVLVLGIGLGIILYSTREGVAVPVVPSESATQAGETQDRRLAFIAAFETAEDRLYIGLDEAMWYAGEAAKDAAVRAGACVPEDRETCAPNDYFIDNAERGISWYPLSSDTEVEMQTLSHDAQGGYMFGEMVSVLSLRELFDDASRAGLWTQLPFWITFEDGMIVRIEEQYIP